MTALQFYVLGVDVDVRSRPGPTVRGALRLSVSSLLRW